MERFCFYKQEFNIHKQIENVYKRNFQLIVENMVM